MICILPRILLASSIAAAATVASAAGTDSVDITARHLRGASAAELGAVAGTYRMHDGRQLVLRQRGAGVVAELDGQATTPMLAQAWLELCSPDGRMVLLFAPDAASGAMAVTLLQRPAADALQAAATVVVAGLR